MKGFATKRIDLQAWEIALYDPHRRVAITLQFTAHQLAAPGLAIETTKVPFDSESEDMMKALAEALQIMGYIPETAVATELKATKYHLEDMRKLALEPPPEIQHSIRNYD